MEFSLSEMIFIAFVALLLYGGRLPKVAMAVGRAVGEFKRGLRETSDLVRYEVEKTERLIRTDEPVKREQLTEVRPALPEPAADPELGTEDLTAPDERA